MRTERIPLLRLLAPLGLFCALPMMAQDGGKTMAETQPFIPMTVIYALIGVAVVQVIFILSLSSIMRTLGGPGAWAKKLAPFFDSLLPTRTNPNGW